MLEGIAMGSAIGGPYGAGGGLILGLITGLITAESHFAQIDAQIRNEQNKDRELEAQIERELAGQRELENQLGSGPGQALATPNATQPIPPPSPGSPSVQQSAAIGPVASLGRKETLPLNSSTPFRNVEVRDLNKDGIPDLWIYYNPAKPGEIIRQEEDTSGDGRVDTWSAFKDGKLVRREVDTKGNGTPDIFYVYDKEVIAREERDEFRNGTRSYRASYQNGRLAKVEKDTQGDGKTDSVIYYDTAKDGEIVLKEEADLDQDGKVDLWTFYEGGKVVRRDVTAVGLDILSAQEKGLFLPPETNENQVFKNDRAEVR
jgi:hypothetical protein